MREHYINQLIIIVTLTKFYAEACSGFLAMVIAFLFIHSQLLLFVDHMTFAQNNGGGTSLPMCGI